MKSNMRSIKRSFTINILLKFFISITVFTVFEVMFVILSRMVISIFTWYEENILYIILKNIEVNLALYMIGFWVLGFITIFIRYWFKVLNSLSSVIKATEIMYNSKDQLVTLPADLKEVENQMNAIMLEAKDNERKAQEAEQRKNDLIVYLAHDLKTPLTSVIGYLSLLRDEGEISEELRKKYLSISLDKAERLEDLINEFFEITRFNLTKMSLDLNEVNLNRMLEQICFEFKPLFEERESDYSLNIEGNIDIKCDIGKIQRVFENLLKNAVYYSFEKSTVEIFVRKNKNMIEIEFTNEGQTIPKEKLARIFEQFYRLDTARITRTGGAGLGLAIAKEIVALHGGTITATSEENKNTFRITLPSRSNSKSNNSDSSVVGKL